MKVRDLMTREPMTVSPDMPVGAAAAVLSERGVSGAPVVAATGEVLGLVTETDLERRLAAAAGREERSWLARLLSAAPAEAREYAKSHGRFVRDIMTPGPATIGPEASVEEAAAMLDRIGVRRLPVVEGGRLVGVLSRADLLRAVLDPEPPTAAPAADDIALRKRLLDALREQSWTHAYRVHFTVRDGVATFYGMGAPTDVQRGLRVLAEGVPGMKAVEFP